METEVYQYEPFGCVLEVGPHPLLTFPLPNPLKDVHDVVYKEPSLVIQNTSPTDELSINLCGSILEAGFLSCLLDSMTDTDLFVRAIPASSSFTIALDCTALCGAIGGFMVGKDQEYSWVVIKTENRLPNCEFSLMCRRLDTVKAFPPPGSLMAVGSVVNYNVSSVFSEFCRIPVILLEQDGVCQGPVYLRMHEFEFESAATEPLWCTPSVFESSEGDKWVAVEDGAKRPHAPVKFHQVVDGVVVDAFDDVLPVLRYRRGVFNFLPSIRFTNLVFRDSADTTVEIIQVVKMNILMGDY
jgi:hypothetical protein